MLASEICRASIGSCLIHMTEMYGMRLGGMRLNRKKMCLAFEGKVLALHVTVVEQTTSHRSSEYKDK